MTVILEYLGSGSREYNGSVMADLQSKPRRYGWLVGYTWWYRSPVSSKCYIRR